MGAVGVRLGATAVRSRGRSRHLGPRATRTLDTMPDADASPPIPSVPHATVAPGGEGAAHP